MARLIEVISRGTRALQPSAASLPNGSLYFVTDEDLIEQVVSAAWALYCNITPSSTTPGGSDKNPQYNNAGAFGGIANNAAATNKFLRQISSGTPAFEQVSGADLPDDSVTAGKLADTAVTPGTYGDADNVAQVTIDQQGRITAASEVPITGGGGGGGLILIENKIFTAAATTYDFSGLDGDTDRIYKLVGKIVVGASGSPFFSTRFNAQATTYSINRSQVAGTTPLASTFTEPYVAGGDAGTVLSFESLIFAAKSVNSVAQRRMYLAQSIATASSAITWNNWRGWWTDTTNNITSIRLHCDTSNGIGDGSQVALYKFEQ